MHAVVGCKLRAVPQSDDEAARLERHDGGIRLCAGLPAQRLVDEPLIALADGEAA